MTEMLRRLALALALLLPLGAAAQSADLYVVQTGDTLFRISRANGLSVERLRALNGLEGDYISVGQTLRLSDRVPLPRQTELPAAPVEPPAPETPAPEPARPLAEPPAPEPPAPEPPAPAAPGAGTHVVQPGETLFRIALRYDTTVEALRRLNGIEGDRIEVGQRLAVDTSGAGRTAAPPAGPAAGPAAPVRMGTPRPWSITETTVPADLVHFVEPGETLYSIAAAYGLPVGAITAENALSTAPLAPGTPVYLPERRNPAAAEPEALPPVEAEGLALVYPEVMAGRRTESGEPYDPDAFTVSHREYPFGTLLLVTNPATGRSTFARVTDRGPVSQTYLVELSAAAAAALRLDPAAAQPVELRRVP